MTALDKYTGETKWTTPRPAMRATNGEFKKAYSTPLIIKVDGVVQAVVPGAQWIVAYEPNTGKRSGASITGLAFQSVRRRSIPATTITQVLVIFTTGYGQSEIVAVDPRGKDDASLSHIAWRSDRNAPEKPSPVLGGGLLYLLDDAGILSCLNAEDGSSVYRKRVPGNYSASPLLAAGHLYLLARKES